MSLQEKIGTAIRAMRAELGLSQEKLAFDAGVGRRYLSDVENGKRNVSLETVEKLAERFGITASEFVRRVERADMPAPTVESLKEALCDRGFEDAVVLENPDFADAVVGTSDDGRVVYDYERMVRSLMREDNMDEEEAREFIDYNTIRALPYMGDKRPVILYGIEEI
ncbi:MAG: helix-turn-helix domain-containing protein [Fibrobacterales bacterium]|nr:helix-turn-helix domain-containing protein [Fibrobacterales bacterium]